VLNQTEKQCLFPFLTEERTLFSILISRRRNSTGKKGKKNVTLRVSTKGLRTIKKYGIDKAAKKYNVDLSKF